MQSTIKISKRQILGIEKSLTICCFNNIINSDIEGNRKGTKHIKLIA